MMRIKNKVTGETRELTLEKIAELGGENYLVFDEGHEESIVRIDMEREELETAQKERWAGFVVNHIYKIKIVDGEVLLLHEGVRYNR